MTGLHLSHGEESSKIAALIHLSLERCYRIFCKLQCHLYISCIFLFQWSRNIFFSWGLCAILWKYVEVFQFALMSWKVDLRNIHPTLETMNLSPKCKPFFPFHMKTFFFELFKALFWQLPAGRCSAVLPECLHRGGLRRHTSTDMHPQLLDWELIN